MDWGLGLRVEIVIRNCDWDMEFWIGNGGLGFGLGNLGQPLGLRLIGMGIWVETVNRLKIIIELEVYLTGCGDARMVRNIANLIQN